MLDSQIILIVMLDSQIILMTRASGHLDRFSDWMVKDEVTGECFRADHLLEEVMKKKAADPKCTSEKKAEYELIAHQVCLLFVVCLY